MPYRSAFHEKDHAVGNIFVHSANIYKNIYKWNYNKFICGIFLFLINLRMIILICDAAIKRVIIKRSNI